MKILVACGACARQFDVSGRAPGDRFHCLCGELVTVPRGRGHEAAVVRCSSCGGPRQRQAPGCGFCGADFTLHERDLHTLCPGCAARVSDRARFCHHCATPIDPRPLEAEAVAAACPACGEERRLTSRRFGEEPISVLECPRCAGLWIGSQAFEQLASRARATAPEAPPRVPPATSPGAQDGALYRPCPECSRLMHRRNYARRSGVILDSCAGHGLWFDGDELSKLLSWIRAGGEAGTRRREEEEDRRRDREEQIRRALDSGPMPVEPGGRSGWPILDLLASILDVFLPDR